MDKRAYRKELRQKLATLPEELISNSSKAICKNISGWLSERPEITKIAVYAALPSEVELSYLSSFLPNLEWHYPCVSMKDMTFHRVSNTASLKKGLSNILEPNPQVHPPVLPASLDAVLCPGLAFTKDGHRLGRGGGFYDRFLSGLTDTPILGVCLEEQIVSQLPSENHDISMTHIVTPQGISKVIDLNGIT